MKRYMEKEPGCQSFFLPHINQQISGHKILVFENKISDLVSKMYAFKFENLSIFASLSHCRQWNGKQIPRFSI